MESANHLKQNWWMFLVRGIVALLFGLITVVSPSTTVVFLALTFGLFLLVSGISSVIYGITSVKKGGFWALYLVLGIIEAGFGVYLLQRPGLTAAAFIVFVAISLMLRGILEVASAFEHGLDGGLRALNIIVGVLTIFAGIVVWRYPVAGTLAFAWVLGLYALIAGPIWIAFSIQARDNKVELNRG